VSTESRFRALVLPHLDAAYNLARWLARDPHDAEDVVQDACVRALKYLDAVRGADAKPWFLTIVRRAFYDWYRSKRSAEILHDAGLAIDIAIDDSAIAQLHEAKPRRQSDELEDAATTLALVNWVVLIVYEMEDASSSDIPLIVDIPIGTVMSRLARARALLQRSPFLRAIVAERAGGRP